ncbi:MAG: hypothetical protein HC905_27595 [Bacteroidales bacterium]|nr:hypothetical protein [Bacteroidales bacterium]
MYLVSVYNSPWKCATKSAEFYKRDGAGLVEFDGKLWLLGGWKHGPGCSEVWNTTDGINWVFLGDAPWPARHSAGFVAFDGFLWIVSGDGNTDVWKSPDGINWEMVTNSAPWGMRYCPYVAVFKNKIWLMGGLSWWDDNGIYSDLNTIAYNDVGVQRMV